MVRDAGRLSVLKVQHLAKPGYHGDGRGLYLQVSGTGAKSWIFRFMLRGKRREMGLGSIDRVSLARAREKAQGMRELLGDGIDPIEHKRSAATAAALQAAKSITFKKAAEAYIEAHAASWKNDKHASQWSSTLEAYAYPHFGSLPVAAVDTTLVLKALEPIWTKKAETASRLRGRIESVLAWATARGYRAGDNPARWRGHLDQTLPATTKIKQKAGTRHHPALPYAEIGAFVEELQKQESTSARALEFLILTAARTSEVILANPAEFDLEAKLWTVPPERMKAKREHRVPLSSRAIELVREHMQIGGEYVFSGMRKSKPMSNMSMLKTLGRMGRSDITTHGFRSTFRDWAAEQTAYAAEVAEMALAHVVSDKTEAAYRRGDLLERRFKIMNDWARYCARPTKQGDSVVVPMRRTGSAK